MGSKMNLTSLLVVSLISASNITLFLDRLVTDGKYENVLFMYDGNDTFIKDTDFLPQLSALSFGKYAMFIAKKDYSKWTSPAEMLPYQEHPGAGVLHILALNYNEGDEQCLARLLRMYHNSRIVKQNAVLLIPTPPDDRQKYIWHQFPSEFVRRCFNIVVIFYSKKMTITFADASRKSIQIFALNFKQKTRKTYEVDVENSVYNGQLNESNLHDKIFGSIIKRPNLVINTVATFKESVLKTTVQRGNETLINLASADYYFSNFIARNLRAEHIRIEQILQYRETVKQHIQSEIYEYSASNEKYYAELYNVLSPSNLRKQMQRFVS